jgi:membrane peptidoglycan carboxypeptidase
VATEDRSFYTNLGVSVRGVARSFWVDMTEGRYAEGGSTLTQELVRDEILGPEKTFRRKLSEALLALAVTARFPKSEILDMYVNEVYLGQGYYGVGTAAIGYFGVPARSLTIGQAAMLAGLPQAPSALDPVAHYAAARHREWIVLQNLVAVHALTPEAARQAFQASLHLRRGRA